MSAGTWRTLAPRVRRTALLVWCIAGVMLVAGFAGVVFVQVSQSAPPGFNGGAPFMTIVAWGVNLVLPALLTVGLASAVVPFFLFALAGRRLSNSADVSDDLIDGDDLVDETLSEEP
jgi:hypothetical protein